MSFSNKLEIQLKVGKLYTKTNSYKRQHDILINSLKRFFSICDKPYLALSFGKQSIILAHAIYQISPETPMVFLRSWESYLIHNFEDVINQFVKNWPINLIIDFADNVSWNNWSWKKTRDYGENDLQTAGDRNVPNWNGVIMGLSKDESFARRITCSIGNTQWKTIFRYKDGRYRNTPIQSWTINDLAGYIASNEIPLLESYKYTGLEGRTVARITRNCAEMNGLVELKKRNIANYNKIIHRFPELSPRG